jgi:hypothetical protein
MGKDPRASINKKLIGAGLIPAHKQGVVPE